MVKRGVVWGIRLHVVFGWGRCLLTQTGVNTTNCDHSVGDGGELLGTQKMHQPVVFSGAISWY